MELRQLAVVVCLSLSPLAVPASAQDANTALSDLVYQDAGWSRGQLNQRGYQSQSDDGQGYEYWWNPARKQCVIMRSERGKVQSVTNAPSLDCGQRADASADNKSSNAAAAVALGAIAILGVAALEHKSHHHDDNQHGNDSGSESEFERGYRDGLYNQNYDENRASSAYGDGYSSGMKDRQNRTSYRGSSGVEVTCESVKDRRNECAMDTNGNVRVVRQLSKASCDQGRTWGLSKHAVWVEGGCRAVFRKD